MLNFKLLLIFAAVMKLADVTDSKSVVREDVPVRVRPAAPKHAKRTQNAPFLRVSILLSVCAFAWHLKNATGKPFSEFWHPFLVRNTVQA